MMLVLAAFMKRSLVVLAMLMSRARRPRFRPTLGDLALLLTVACLVFIAAGDAGEEFRFVISLLPLLALRLVFAESTVMPLESLLDLDDTAAEAPGPQHAPMKEPYDRPWLPIADPQGGDARRRAG